MKHYIILSSPDYVWCSHQHGDHYDQIHINLKKSKYQINFTFKDRQFYNKVIKNGFDVDKIIELNDLNTLFLTNRISATMLFEEPHYTNHSSLMLQFNQFKFIHNADTTPNKTFYDKVNLLNLDGIDLLLDNIINALSMGS